VNRTRVKFCGLTRPGDVRLACELGVDALGFVLAPRSPRRLSAGELPGLRAAVSPLVDVVALFMDPAASEVLDAMRRLRPTLLQFHGSEEDSFCRSFGLPFLKSLPMAGGPEEALSVSRRYPSALAFLLDGHGPGLAGGLRPGNVGEAIRAVRPYAVDVSSGIESAPGQKDGERMRQFLEEVRRVDSEQYQ
jgi:phosphoribosylanthranilate isomerase